MEELINQATKIIANSKYIVAFTGAGISTESGIPDFRSTGGVWTKFDPYEYGSYQGFLKDPSKYWSMAKETRKILEEARPNDAHKALAILEQEYCKVKTVITQNIDYLHTIAGNSKVLELHGTYHRNFCLDCMGEFSVEDVRIQLDSNIIPPKCECGGVIKSSSILFGEPLPAGVFQEARREVQRCDCLIVIGTSLQVQPAASLPMMAAASGSKVIIINKEPTNSDYLAKVVIHGNASSVLGEVIGKLGKIDIEEPSISISNKERENEEQTPISHVTERAREHLLKEDIGKLFSDKEQSQVAIHYFSILDNLEREFLEKKINLDEKDSINFKKNGKILNEKKQIIIEDFSLGNLLNKFSEGFILGALTTGIREREANVNTFVEYQLLVEKLKEWPTIGFSSYFIRKSWEDVNNAIEEINSWLIQKKDEYFPIIVELIKLNIEGNNEIFTHLKTCNTDKEMFYLIANTLETNPYLNAEIIDYLKESGIITFEKFRERLIKFLTYLSTHSSDTKMQQIVNLFLSRPKLE
ncbi:MAG: SIR2 family NAD-dependent protein deacylase [Candidatus Hodarchaeales archaeon]